VSALQQRVQIGGYLCGVLPGVGGFAPPAAGTVVDADPGVPGDGRRDPPEIRRHLPGARLQHDGGRACAGAAQVQAVSAHVDQLPRHRVGLGIGCCTQGLVAAADRGQRQHRDHWIQQPASESARKLSMDTDEHPDGQGQHGRGPHPVEHLVHRGAKPHQEQAAHPHEQCRSRGPSLRLIGEPHREHRQHRPPEGESAQDGASDGTLLGRDERGGGEEYSSEESGGQRAGDDPTNVSPRPGIRVGPTVPALVLGGGFGRHDGLHSMHSPAPHYWHECRQLGTRRRSPILIARGGKRAPHRSLLASRAQF
jgi:hypothetical protein